MATKFLNKAPTLARIKQRSEGFRVSEDFWSFFFLFVFFFCFFFCKELQIFQKLSPDNPQIAEMATESIFLQGNLIFRRLEHL